MSMIATISHNDTVELPSVEETVAAMAILGRILDELRARLAAAERTVASMQLEKRALQAELHSLVEYAARRAPYAAPASFMAQEPANVSLDDSLAALVKGIDASFGRLHH